MIIDLFSHINGKSFEIYSKYRSILTGITLFIPYLLAVVLELTAESEAVVIITVCVLSELKETSIVLKLLFNRKTH